ncbi:MAG TPA: hypothetical protein VGM87_15630 [Roseomonas sp.]|jgi:hypothetical protein
MAAFFSWRDKTSPDIDKWKARNLAYTFNGVASNKAFWVFSAASAYKPGKNIAGDRFLLKMEFDEAGTQAILLPDNHIYTEDNFNAGGARFLGEAKHPRQVIVKNNEVGAYGIGAMIRSLLIIQTLAPASKAEVVAALGISSVEMNWTNKWP